MKNSLQMVIGAAGLLAGIQSAQAADVRFPTKAQTYTTWMVRAFNQCTPSGLTVTSAGFPTAGCVATASDLLPPGNPLGATMNFAKLVVRKFGASEGRVRVYGRGFQAGQRIKVRLTLRTTRSGVFTKHPPSVNNTVTFADQAVDCDNASPNCFVANAGGVLAGSQALSACLTANSLSNKLAGENVQIVNAELVNCDTGNVVAVPGIFN